MPTTFFLAISISLYAATTGYQKAVSPTDTITLTRKMPEAWRQACEQMQLKEFSQDQMTCENSFGWSRIDRAYTNLHAVDISMMHTACFLLEQPRHLSDHRPFAVVFARRKAKQSRPIPSWVIQHPDFRKELHGQYNWLVKSFTEQNDKHPSPFDKLKLFKEGAQLTAKHIRNKCRHEIAETKEHRLAACLAFIRASREGRFEKARCIQRNMKQLRDCKVFEGMEGSASFKRVLDLAEELMHIDIKERADELRNVRDQLSEYEFELRKRRVETTLSSMTPGGSAEVMAMLDARGNVITDTGGIADILNQHWQKTFEHKETDAVSRKVWLNQFRGKFKVDKHQLRPTKEIIQKVIQECADSAAGPDSIPFAVYKRAGQIAVDLFYEAANSLLDGADEPDDSFNLAFMVCFTKSESGTTCDGSPIVEAKNTRPISIVDASNRILASIFCNCLESRIGRRINLAQKGFLKNARCSVMFLT